MNSRSRFFHECAIITAELNWTADSLVIRFNGSRYQKIPSTCSSFIRRCGRGFSQKVPSSASSRVHSIDKRSRFDRRLAVISTTVQSRRFR
jgi:hypothetical protein